MFLIGWIFIISLYFLNVLPLGVVFIWSLFSFLYSLFTMFQRETKLTSFGIGYLVGGLIIAIITGLQIFMNYNVLDILFK